MGKKQFEVVTWMVPNQRRETQILQHGMRKI